MPALGRRSSAAPETTWLLMENSAGAGGTIGRSIDELAALYEALDRHPRLGICLDSCHLWVSGFDVTDRGELDRMLEDVDARIGLDRLRACTSTTRRRRSARTATGTRTSSTA